MKAKELHSPSPPSGGRPSQPRPRNMDTPAPARSLRIVIADDEPRVRDYLWRCLEHMGHVVVGAARTGKELIELCRSHQPDLVISDIKMPDMDGIDAARVISVDDLVPIIFISAYHDPDTIARASRSHVLAYLVKPIKETDLEPAIAIALGRFQEFRTLRQEAQDARQALEDRKTIERAKGILMQRTGMSEPEAFRRLQKLASRKSRKLVDVAHMVVTTEEICADDDEAQVESP